MSFVARRLTVHSLSLFLFHCFLAVLVRVVETRVAWGWTRGFSESKLCTTDTTEKGREVKIKDMLCTEADPRQYV